jgi:hypothetical protein
MKTITLKMRDSPTHKHFGGQRGEHRMVELIIPLPRDKLLQIQSCVALFSCDDQLALSPLILPGDAGDCYIANDKVHVVLWQRLTQCWVLRVQLECFGDSESKQFIARTEISERIVFGKSLADSSDNLPEIEDQPNVIAQLLAAMHQHGNMSVLEELGDLAGQLSYKGEPVRARSLSNLQLEALIQQALNNS